MVTAPDTLLKTKMLQQITDISKSNAVVRGAAQYTYKDLLFFAHGESLTSFEERFHLLTIWLSPLHKHSVCGTFSVAGPHSLR